MYRAEFFLDSHLHVTRLFAYYLSTDGLSFVVSDNVNKGLVTLKEISLLST